MEYIKSQNQKSQEISSKKNTKENMPMAIIIVRLLKTKEKQKKKLKAAKIYVDRQIYSSPLNNNKNEDLLLIGKKNQGQKIIGKCLLSNGGKNTITENSRYAPQVPFINGGKTDIFLERRKRKAEIICCKDDNEISLC